MNRIALLLCLFACLPASAETMAPAPPIVMVPASPPLTVSGDELIAKVQAVTAALADLQARLGMPSGAAAIPVSFWSTKAGQAITITLACVGAAAAVASTSVAIYEAVK
jgi:hypothetical protein